MLIPSYLCTFLIQKTDTLAFRVAQFQSENLMNPRNLSVVFAPSLMRDETGEFELRDTHAKNEALQFLIENAKPIFAGVNL